MIKFIKYSAFTLLCAVALSLTSCQDKATTQGQKKPAVEYTNSFDFGDDTYAINSVVRNETVTTIELWLSPVAGLKTISEVTAKGHYAVLSANKTYVGGRDLLQKDGSYLAFVNQRMDNTNNAMAFIDMTFDGDYVYLNFKAEDLFVGNVPVNKFFSGSYEGTFVNHEQTLQNEWSFNRVIRKLFGAKVHIKTVTDENGNFLKDENDNFILTNNTTFTLYDDESRMHEALSVTIPESKYGTEIVELADILSLTYDNGKAYELSSSANINNLLLSLNNNIATVDVDLASGGKLLSANYNGPVEIVEEKPNHIICQTYDKVDGEWVKTPVPLIQEVRKLFIEKTSSDWDLYFATYDEAQLQHKDVFTSISIQSKYADSGYWFAPAALGRFKYHNNDLMISTSMPFGGDVDAQATMMIESDTSGNCKVVFRIKDLFITNSKIADVEVFYNGPISY